MSSVLLSLSAPRVGLGHGAGDGCAGDGCTDGGDGETGVIGGGGQIGDVGDVCGIDVAVVVDVELWRVTVVRPLAMARAAASVRGMSVHVMPWLDGAM